MPIGQTLARREPPRGLQNLHRLQTASSVNNPQSPAILASLQGSADAADGEGKPRASVKNDGRVSRGTRGGRAASKGMSGADPRRPITAFAKDLSMPRLIAVASVFLV